VDPALERILIPEHELAPFRAGDSLADRAGGLLRQQVQSWELLRNNYASLAIVETKVFAFDGFDIQVQFNPKRITSSAAKVDDTSIRERKCFLCLANLPADQRGFLYRSDYIVLSNPFPIFPEHFTIPNIEHRPQRIAGSFGTFLELARDLAGHYVVVYNGPRAGASAPDHQHFQAGTRHFMPVDNEYEILKASRGNRLVESHTLRVFSVEDYLRRVFIFESPERDTLERVFMQFHDAFSELTPPGEEPMMNIEAWFENGEWKVILFPRAKHRPSVFYAEGDRHMLLSPAAIDMGGVCTTPLEKDFRKITKDDLVEMYAEVSLPASGFAHIAQRLMKSLGREDLL
jgi:hypothetical protein